jgi:hypothetical protein
MWYHSLDKCSSTLGKMFSNVSVGVVAGQWPCVLRTHQRLCGASVLTQYASFPGFSGKYSRAIMSLCVLRTNRNDNVIFALHASSGQVALCQFHLKISWEEGPSPARPHAITFMVPRRVIPGEPRDILATTTGLRLSF